MSISKHFGTIKGTFPDFLGYFKPYFATTTMMTSISKHFETIKGTFP